MLLWCFGTKMSVHRMNRHGLRVEHNCEQCQAELKTSRELVNHRLEVHLGKRRMPCEVEGCWFETHDRKTLLRHAREGRHGERPRRGRNATTVEAMEATGARSWKELRSLRRRSEAKKRREQIKKNVQE